MSGQGKAPPTRRHRARARFPESVQHCPVCRVTMSGLCYCPNCAMSDEELGFTARHDDLDFPRLLVFVLGLAIGAGMVGIAWGWS